MTESKTKTEQIIIDIKIMILPLPAIIGLLKSGSLLLKIHVETQVISQPKTKAVEPTLVRGLINPSPKIGPTSVIIAQNITEKIGMFFLFSFAKIAGNSLAFPIDASKREDAINIPL